MSLEAPDVDSRCAGYIQAMYDSGKWTKPATDQPTPPSGDFRYVRHEEVPAYKENGWTAHDSLEGTPHGRYAVLMEGPKQKAPAHFCLRPCGGKEWELNITDGDQRTYRLNLAQLNLLVRQATNELTGAIEGT